MEELALSLLEFSVGLLSIPVPLLARRIVEDVPLSRFSPQALSKLQSIKHGNVRGRYGEGFYRIKDTLLLSSFAWSVPTVCDAEVYGRPFRVQLIEATGLQETVAEKQEKKRELIKTVCKALRPQKQSQAI